MNYLFTSESVSEGHPDKVADQISDAVLDQFLAHDPKAKVACETLVTTGQVVVAGEVRSDAYVDIPVTVRNVIKKIGYDRSDLKFDGEACGVLSALHEQSGDINRGVERESPAEQGAGDQGMMFGYATDETDLYIPVSLAMSHALLKELAAIRRSADAMTYTDANGRQVSYLRPDSKSQVTIEYNDSHEPVRVHTIVISTQHDEFITPAEGETQEQTDARMLEKIREDVRNVLIPRVIAQLPEKVKKLFDGDFILHVNPTGKFVIGGPHGDTGLTGRKIIVDTYGGFGAHGGGAFSGKDPSKVDRAAAYAARHLAKNLVNAGIARRVLVQVAYAIGVAKPVSLYVDTQDTSNITLTDAELSNCITRMPAFDMTPYGIEERLGLCKPIYLETASYGHFGRTPRKVVKHFHSPYEGDKDVEVELFTWEKTDCADLLRKEFAQYFRK